MPNYPDPDAWAEQSLVKKIKGAIFDHPFEGRNNAPFWLVIEALLKTNEDQSGRLVALEATCEATLKELRELKDKLGEK